MREKYYMIDGGSVWNTDFWWEWLLFSPMILLLTPLWIALLIAFGVRWIKERKNAV